jgi:hypothetical protein
MCEAIPERVPPSWFTIPLREEAMEPRLVT